MTTYMFLTKERELADAVRNADDWWSCSKTTAVGDRVLVYYTGREGGIAHEWRAISDAKRDPESQWPYQCRVTWVKSFVPIISLDEMRRSDPTKKCPIVHYPQGISVRLEEAVAERLCSLRTRREKGTSRAARTRASHGAGFGDPDTNPEIERAAVNHVRDDYESRGWEVETREKDKVGYDLDCRRGRLLRRVEVKGTSGNIESFFITKNELNRLNTDDLIVLAIVLRATDEEAAIMREYSALEARARFSFSCVNYKAVKIS